MEELERMMRDHAFLEDMDEAKVRALLPSASLVRFAPGEYLVRQGAPARGTFLIIWGSVALEIARNGRGAVPVQTVPRGEVIGWSWLLSPHRWHFDARALEETRAIFLDGTKLRAICDADRDLGYEIARRLLTVAHARIEALRGEIAEAHASTRV